MDKFVILMAVLTSSNIGVGTGVGEFYESYSDAPKLRESSEPMRLERGRGADKGPQSLLQAIQGESS